MRIVSWNVAKRRDCEAQADALLQVAPDVVVLQEVMPWIWPRLRERLSLGGFAHLASGVQLATSSDPTRKLVSFVAVASRWRLLPTPGAPVPAQEAVTCVAVDSPSGVFDVIGVHIPTAERRDVLLKVETQEGLLLRLADPRRPTIVCGDFNSPRAESIDGVVTPFAAGRGGRARAAELALMGSVNASGMVDLYRECHGYSVDGASWFWKNRGTTGGFRLDHIFASPSVKVRNCDYIHAWRDSRLSDHSAIYADIELVEGETAR